MYICQLMKHSSCGFSYWIHDSLSVLPPLFPSSTVVPWKSSLGPTDLCTWHLETKIPWNTLSFHPVTHLGITGWHHNANRDINTWVGIQSPGSAKCMPQDTTQEFKQKLWLKNLGTTQLSCCSDITWRMLQKSRVAKPTRNGCSNVGKVFCCLKKKKSFKENRARKSFLEKTATNWQEFCLTEFKIQPCSAYLLKGNVTKESSFCEIFQKTNLIDLSAVPYCSAVPIAKNMRIKY